METLADAGQCYVIMQNYRIRSKHHLTLWTFGRTLCILFHPRDKEGENGNARGRKESVWPMCAVLLDGVFAANAKASGAGNYIGTRNEPSGKRGVLPAASDERGCGESDPVRPVPGAGDCAGLPAQYEPVAANGTGRGRLLPGV